VEMTRRHLAVAGLLALLLHGALFRWFASAPPENRRVPQRERPLTVSLVAEMPRAVLPVPSPSVTPVPRPDPLPRPAPPTQSPEPRPDPEPLPGAVTKPVVEAQRPAPRDRAEPRPPPAEAASRPEPERAIPEQTSEPQKVVETEEAPPPDSPRDSPLDHRTLVRYEELIVAWLERHKKYPRRARRLRIEGEGMLRILIDRAGRLQRVELVRRTGNRLLDRAALEMARRADPFPPLPEGDTSPSREFIVPVAFVLR